MLPSPTSLSSETATRQRYAAAAKTPEAALCCPVHYDPKYLKIIPAEVIEKDYGCGDPSQHVHADETVLDLGSGTGKICFIAAQVVGPKGRVIGVDMTDDMLEVARRNAPVVSERLGYANVEFRKGRIQDLALDLELLDTMLQERPVRDTASYLEAEALADKLREQSPLIPTATMDVVVSNCVLNLVATRHRQQLFQEIFRVLKIGGRAVISDIVAGVEVPAHLQQDSQLWSGCISGAFTEAAFIQAFASAGFGRLEILQRGTTPWQIVEGIAFHSMTVQAWKTALDPSTSLSARCMVNHATKPCC